MINKIRNVLLLGFSFILSVDFALRIFTNKFAQFSTIWIGGFALYLIFLAFAEWIDDL